MKLNQVFRKQGFWWFSFIALTITSSAITYQICTTCNLFPLLQHPAYNALINAGIVLVTWSFITFTILNKLFDRRVVINSGNILELVRQTTVGLIMLLMVVILLRSMLARNLNEIFTLIVTSIVSILFLLIRKPIKNQWMDLTENFIVKLFHKLPPPR